MSKDTVQMTVEKYREFVAIQYLNASTFLYDGLKSQQGKNEFHFVVSMRSFIEYTRRGIWFLVWASDEKVRAVKTFTFNRPGSPPLVDMDKLINQALGLGKMSHLNGPTRPINNEPFIDCLHALTHVSCVICSNRVHRWSRRRWCRCTRADLARGEGEPRECCHCRSSRR